VTTIPKMPSHLRELLPLRRREDYKVTTNDNMTLFEIDFFPWTTEDNAVIDYIIALLNAQATEQPAPPAFKVGDRVRSVSGHVVDLEHTKLTEGTVIALFDTWQADGSAFVGQYRYSVRWDGDDIWNAPEGDLALAHAPVESAPQPAPDLGELLEARMLIRRLCDAVESVLAAHGTYAPNLTAYRDAIAYLDR
jgi:hypothetical protein